MFSFSKKGNAKNIQTKLAIDIGTHSVKVVLFTDNGGRDIEIVGYASVKQKTDAMFKALIVSSNDVKDTVDKAIGMAIQSAKKTAITFDFPTKCVVGIAGELVKGVPIVVNVDRENPNEVISIKEIKHIVNKVKEHTFESTVDELSEEIGVPVTQITEIDSYIDSIYVDEIKVSNPIGLRGGALKIKVFSTFAPKVHYDSIYKIIKELNLEIEKVIVEPYALSVSLDGIRKENEGAIFIDIGGGTTDIAIVKNGEVMGTKMFAIGGRVFTKRLEKELNLAVEEAEKNKIDYSNGKLDAVNAKRIKDILKIDIETWMKGVEISLEEFEDVSEYPPYIYICGGGALLPEIMESLLEYGWMQNFNFKKHPKVNFFFPNKISNLVDLTKEAKSLEDVTPLSLTRVTLEL